MTRQRIDWPKVAVWALIVLACVLLWTAVIIGSSR